MKHSRQEVFQFQGLNSRKVTADFTGGDLGSDGGALGHLILIVIEEGVSALIFDMSPC